MSQPVITWKQFRSFLRGFVCAMLALCPVFTQAETIAVLYPQTREPYLQVYTNIIQGIESEYKKEVQRFAIAESTSAEEVKGWLDAAGIEGLVILGNQSLSRLPAENERPFVVGGTILKPQSAPLPGISINPSLSSLFGGLLELQPTVSEIHVVYEADYNGWVIAEAIRAAEQLDLTLHAHTVSGLREAAAKYREVQKSLDPDRSALWLPLGGPSREKFILQSILQTAWSRDQIVISSNLADVRRGALYAIYPNNHAMGQDLAKALLAQLEDRENATSVFLSSTFQAINLRTAEHIGLRLTKDDLSLFIPLNKCYAAVYDFAV